MKPFGLLRKGFLILVGVLVVALGAVVVFGADALFERAIRTYGPPLFGQPVALEEADLSVFGGSAGVDAFRVGTEEQPLLEVQRASMDASVLAALGGRVHVQDAELSGTVLHLVVREDGSLSFDPGPPPPGVREEKPMPPREEPLPPPEERDLVQIAVEYWQRYRHYREYYDEYGGLFGGGDGEKQPAKPKRERVRYPGKPGFVAQAQQEARTAADARGTFWMERAEIHDFRWETRDERSGEPLLPALENFSFSLEHVGAAPPGATMPAAVRGAGALEAGGEIVFRLGLSRTAEPSTLSFQAKELPVDAVLHLAQRSLPFRVQGGIAGVHTEDIAFAPDLLRGSIRLELRNAEVLPKPGSPEVLGVPPGEFCSLLNAALKEQPVAFLLSLDGTPTDPSFSVENETDLGDALGGAVKAEAERRARELIDEKSGELQDRLKEELGDEIGDGAGERLGDELEKGLGGLFGGSKKDDDGG